MRTAPLTALVVPWLLPCALLAAVPGGGPARQDCHLELDAPAPNYPPSPPGKPTMPREVRCFDGDAGCDLDGEVDGACRFPLDACFRVNDPALPECAAAHVESFAVGGAGGNADLRALQQAGQALLPATASVCTAGQAVRVPLGRGGKKAARRVIRLKARTRNGTDADRIAFTCVPHAWPSYGYDHRHRRATPRGSTRWFRFPAVLPVSGSSTPPPPGQTTRCTPRSTRRSSLAGRTPATTSTHSPTATARRAGRARSGRAGRRSPSPTGSSSSAPMRWRSSTCTTPPVGLV